MQRKTSPRSAQFTCGSQDAYDYHRFSGISGGQMPALSPQSPIVVCDSHPKRETPFVISRSYTTDTTNANLGRNWRLKWLLFL